MGSDQIDSHRSNEGSAMKKSSRKSQAGFTLTELAIIVAILPIVVMGVVLPLIEWPKQYAAIAADQEMDQQLRNAIQWMGRDIRQAEAVMEQAGSFKTSANNTLVLAAPENESPRVIVWTVEGDALTRAVFSDAEASSPLEKITIMQPQGSFSIKFDKKPPDASKLRVTIKAGRNILDRAREAELSGEFHLRRAFQ